MWKDVITSLFKVRSLNFHEGTGENHKNSSHVFPEAPYSRAPGPRGQYAL